jgi:hypothetical protein
VTETLSQEERHLLIERRDGVLILTMNRPVARNALSPQMLVLMAEAWHEFRDSKDLRVAILTGAGAEDFSAGGDLKLTMPLITGARKPEDEWDHRLVADLTQFTDAILRGFGLYKPIEPAEFQARRKNLLLVYIEVENFVSKKTPSGLYRTLLSVRQSLVSRDGQELWSKKDENIEDLARRQRRDFYLTIGPIAIPKSLAPGSYILNVEVEDALAGKMNRAVAKFKLLP